MTGKPFNASAAEATIAAAAESSPSINPRTTEDCLFLDVVVPEQIFNEADSSGSSKKSAPVLIWIYGGGYTVGEKTGFGVYNPAGLINASQINGSEGVIYVALNYRVDSSHGPSSRAELTYLAWGFRLAGWADSSIRWYRECWPLRPTFGSAMGAGAYPLVRW